MRENGQLEQASLSPQEILRFFRRRRQTLFLLFSSSMIVMILVAYLLPEQYETSARVLVKVGRESVPASTLLLPEESPGSVMDLRDHINSQIEILRSELLVRRILDQLGVDRFLAPPSPGERTWKTLVFGGFAAGLEGMRDLLDRLDLLKRLPPVERVISRIMSRLTVSPVPESSVIRVTFRWSDPSLAAEVVNRLIDLYLSHSLEVQRSKEGLALMHELVVDLKQAMSDANERLMAYKRAHGTTSLPDQQHLLLRQLMEQEALIQNTEAQIAEAGAMIRTIDRQLASLPATVKLSQVERSNPVNESLRLRESELEIELRKVRARYDDESPIVASLMQQIAALRARLAMEKKTILGDVTSGLNTTYKTLETERLQKVAVLSALQEKRKALQGYLRSVREQLLALNRTEADIARLETESGIAIQNYDFARQKLESLRLSEMMDMKKIVSVHPLEQAQVPLRPARSRLLIVIIGMIGSLIFAVGGVITAEYFDRSIKGPNDVKRYIHLPTLGVIPNVKAPPLHSDMKGIYRN